MHHSSTRPLSREFAVSSDSHSLLTIFQMYALLQVQREASLTELYSGRKNVQSDAANIAAMHFHHPHRPSPIPHPPHLSGVVENDDAARSHHPRHLLDHISPRLGRQLMEQVDTRYLACHRKERQEGRSARLGDKTGGMR